MEGKITGTKMIIYVDGEPIACTTEAILNINSLPMPPKPVTTEGQIWTVMIRQDESFEIGSSDIEKMEVDEAAGKLTFVVTAECAQRLKKRGF